MNATPVEPGAVGRAEVLDVPTAADNPEAGVLARSKFVADGERPLAPTLASVLKTSLSSPAWIRSERLGAASERVMAFWPATADMAVNQVCRSCSLACSHGGSVLSCAWCFVGGPRDALGTGTHEVKS